MDYLTMRDIFKGLASSGSWGCFDEFNRLMAEVLSVCTIQWKSVLDGMRDGWRPLPLRRHRDLPAPRWLLLLYHDEPRLPRPAGAARVAKVLFRPVTVMVPDFQLIMENMLMSEGYTTAAELAKKFYTLYKLSGDLLGGNPSPPGKQLHYDWGLRAIGSVLRVAGAFLRGEKAELTNPSTKVGAEVKEYKERLNKDTMEDIYEQGSLCVRCATSTSPRLLATTRSFKGLIKDLFGEVYDLMPKKRDYDFEERVRELEEEEAARFRKKLSRPTTLCRTSLTCRICSACATASSPLACRATSPPSGRCSPSAGRVATATTRPASARRSGRTSTPSLSPPMSSTASSTSPRVSGRTACSLSSCALPERARLAPKWVILDETWTPTGLRR